MGVSKKVLVPVADHNAENIVPEISNIHAYHMDPRNDLGDYVSRVRARNTLVRAQFDSARLRIRSALEVHEMWGYGDWSATSQSGTRKTGSFRIDFGPGYVISSFVRAGKLYQSHRTEGGYVSVSWGGQNGKGNVTVKAKYSEATVLALIEAEVTKLRAMCRVQNLPDDTTIDP
jgi:hypothetical protein